MDKDVKMKNVMDKPVLVGKEVDGAPAVSFHNTCCNCMCIENSRNEIPMQYVNSYWTQSAPRYLCYLPRQRSRS